MKRFYQDASHGEAEEGWPLKLDGKPAKTPAGKFLTSPSKLVAKAIVYEWKGQKEKVDPQSMPLTQIQTTRLDFIDGRQEEAISQILKFVNSDLILYRADKPEELKDKQERIWDPWLDWMSKQFMAHYETTTNLVAVAQDPSIQDSFEGYLRKLDLSELTVFYILTTLTKSPILTMAFLEKECSPADLFQATQIEEMHKAELYGENDPEIEKAQKNLRQDIDAARVYIDLLRNI